MNAPGLVPYLALAAWLPITLILFSLYRPAKAGVISMLAGMLLLPQVVTFDAPLIPPLGKFEVTALSTYLGCLFFGHGVLRKAKLARGVGWLAIALLGATIITAMTNRDTLVDGPVVRAGLGFHDVPAVAIRDTLAIVLPFLLGRALIGSRRDLDWLIRAIVIAGLLYSALELFEIRMSPRLHRTFYGYDARLDFAQTRRWGGWRPTVFLEHGLAVGVFALASTIAAAGWSRVARRVGRFSSKTVALYLSVVLVLCRSTGAIVLALVLAPMARWARPQRALRIAGIVALICFAYPILKFVDVFPSQAIVNLTTSATDADRAGSLAYRFANDELLIARARQRLLFGWGPNGRNQVLDSDGRQVSVTDGYWIIVLGERGLVGFFTVFGLLLWPAIAARKRLRAVQDPDSRRLMATLALLLVGYTFDLLPNGLFATIPFFYAGALDRVNRALPLEEAKAAADEGELGDDRVAVG